VFVGLGIEVPLCQSKVNDVYNFSLLPPSYHKVIGLYISMHEALAMDLLQSRYDLNTNVESG
jgi:hypothetical protein